MFDPSIFTKWEQCFSAKRASIPPLFNFWRKPQFLYNFWMFGKEFLAKLHIRFFVNFQTLSLLHSLQPAPTVYVWLWWYLVDVVYFSVTRTTSLTYFFIPLRDPPHPADPAITERFQRRFIRDSVALMGNHHLLPVF